jgi:hypothetical protein
VRNADDFSIEQKRRIFMQSLTYKDIIDDKITEWQSGLQKIETLTEKATSDAKTRLSSQLEQLKSTIDSAIVQLRHLDEQETVENTMETKDKILKIFSSVDQSFQGVEDKTPFML